MRKPPYHIPSVHVPLDPFDSPAGVQRRAGSKDPRIDSDKTYFAKIHGEWFIGQFSEQWYGWNFNDWGTSGIQLDSIEDLWEASLGVDEVWELTFYDSGADDNRGRTYSRGLFHHRENAQAAADRNNQAILERYSAEDLRHYRQAYTSAVEHNACVDAGIRLTKVSLPIGPPSPRTSRPTRPSRIPGGKPVECGDWWEVGPFDFDWMDEK